MVDKDMTHLMVNIFETKASALDLAKSEEGLHEANIRLAKWIEKNEGKLTEGELLALIYIGGLVFREGIRHWD